MVTKNELRCKWVSQEIKCFDFMPGCKQVAIASLDEDCDKKLLVLNKSLPAIGHVNTKTYWIKSQVKSSVSRSRTAPIQYHSAYENRC